MHEFEDVLPHISRRVVAVGETPRAGHIARFDNDVYFRAMLMGNIEFPGDVLRFVFQLFFNADGSRATPAMESLDAILTVHMDYDMTFPGSLLGDAAIRADLRRLKGRLGRGRPSLVAVRIGQSGRAMPWSPHFWTAMGFTMPTSRIRGPREYDWSALGANVLDSLDSILQVLEKACPKGTEFPSGSR